MDVAVTTNSEELAVQKTEKEEAPVCAAPQGEPAGEEGEAAKELDGGRGNEETAAQQSACERDESVTESAARQQDGGDGGTSEAAAAIVPVEPEQEGAPPVPVEEEEPRAKEQPATTRRERMWSVDPSQGVDLVVSGASELGRAEPTTIGRVFRETVAKVPDHPALRYKEEGEWKTITYSQYYSNCVQAAKSFLKIGLEPFHAVAIIGFNAPPWVISNLGAVFAGGVATGIYTTSNSQACQFVANSCMANVIVVEDQKQLDKILEVREELPHLKAIVQYKGKLSQDYPNVYDWEQFMKLGEDIEDSVIEEKVDAQRPEQCALLLYTSGTTGDPKGVMLSHDNLTWTARALSETLELKWQYERIVSYLPLSHSAAQIEDIYVPIGGACTLHFAQPDALKGTLFQTVGEVLPTFFFGVPRVWEKLREGMQAAAVNNGAVKTALVNWAKGRGLKGNRNLQQGQGLPWGWSIANSLVFNKVRATLGFSECRIFLTAAAPISMEVLEFFSSLNLPILEIFGMTESSGPHTSNMAQRWRMGSIGQAMNGVQIKIDSPDENGEGEIIMYGRNVFMGYINNEEKTREAIDDEGWLHSGDIGRMDENGFVYITGRIKELLITAGGENLAPVPIEDRIKKQVPFLSNVMVIGDKRKYLSCVVTLKCAVDAATGAPKDELLPQVKQMVAALGSTATTSSEIVDSRDKAVYDAIQAGLDRANEEAMARPQRVQKFIVLKEDFSIIGGELGPTLKLKRRMVLQRYAAEIDAIYEE